MKVESINNNKDSHINFKAFRLAPQAIQAIDFQPDKVKKIFIQGQNELKNSKFWDLEYKNNEFKIIGKDKFSGLEFGENFKLAMYHDDAILSPKGKHFYDADNLDNIRVIYDFKLGETTKEEINKLNSLKRIEKAIELTKFMENQSKSKKDLDIIFLD